MTEKIDLLTTMDLCAALKAQLATIMHPTLGGPLFETIEFNENKNLAEAVAQLLLFKKRICLIVPAGDRFENTKEARSMRSQRFTTVDLLMADQAYLKGGHDAVFGGDANIGVMAMKDLVQVNLAENPQLTNLRWCALYPTEGALLSLSADQEKQTPGRQAFVLNYETPSGVIITPFTTAWPALPA